MDRERRRRESILESRTRDTTRQAKADRCAGYESRSKYLESRADTWFTPKYREDDRAEAQALKDRHWSECFAGR